MIFLSRPLFLVLLLAAAALPFGNEDIIRISDNLRLVKLSGNSFVHVSIAEIEGFGKVSSNGLVYINNGEAIICDTPVDEKETIELINYVKDSLNAKITAFVPNHWHNDCIGGLKIIKDSGIPSYANQMTIDIAAQKGLPVPENGFKDSLVLKIGEESIICKYPGAGHSTDNIVVYIPSEKILFAGCMAKEMDAAGKGNLSDADLSAWPNTIKNVQREFSQAKIVIPGHGTFGGPELLDHTLEVLNK
jgi:metallo-beta-lactamase class B